MVSQPFVGSLYPPTMGEWSTESESARALDERLAVCNLFTAYPEVPGVLIHPRPVGDYGSGTKVGAR
jgi:hypothetical protein